MLNATQLLQLADLLDLASSEQLQHIIQDCQLELEARDSEL